MRTLVAVWSGPVYRAFGQKPAWERAHAGSHERALCVIHICIRHLPTHLPALPYPLPTRLTDYLHFSPTSARWNRLRDIRSGQHSNWPPSVKNQTSQNTRAPGTVNLKLFAPLYTLLIFASMKLSSLCCVHCNFDNSIFCLNMQQEFFTLVFAKSSVPQR